MSHLTHQKNGNDIPKNIENKDDCHAELVEEKTV